MPESSLSLRGQKSLVALTNNNILQANCVIISGLLILFGIQSFGPTPISDVNLDYGTLKSEYNDLNATMVNDAEDVQKYLSAVEQNQNDLSTKLLYDESVKKLDLDKEEMSKIDIQLSELKAILTLNNSIPQYLAWFAYPKLLVGILLMPFIFSAVLSMKHTLHQITDDRAGKIQLISLIVGLVFLVIGLVLTQEVSIIVATKLPQL
ncbi:MAG TPA: hypothetical protein VJR22_08320 [Candidatus Nitrosotalea sp.]|nr:hypothetical protein [Candidatus Nitrosotalea sp.]